MVTTRLTGSVSRAVSGLEFALAAGLVAAHNVFKAVPSEVFLLAGLGLLSLLLRNRSIFAFGFGRPRSWAIVVTVAVAAAATRIFLGDLVIDPWTAQYFPPAKAPEVAEGITGNPGAALKLLALVWVFAALGEEFAYRGYILNRGAEALGGTRAAYLLAMLGAALLFGIGHFYKGPAGMIDSGVAGLILGIAYLITGRNLWAPILAHGLIDTTGVAFLYFGWDS